MSQPTNLEEYLRRFKENEKMSGFGVGADGAKMHFPCPFCGAADYSIQPIVIIDEQGIRSGVEANMQTPITCGECGRSAKMIVTRHVGGVQIECVQTGGPDQPEWLKPHMRRVD